VNGPELERIEVRLIALQKAQEQQAKQAWESQRRIVALLEKVVELLEEPETFPASTGGTITVK
jgi:hypothetical protein